MPQWREEPSSVRPMLASTTPAPLESDDLAYEPKYDGIRTLVSIEPERPERSERSGLSVRLWSRLGNEKSRQFPDIVSAVREWARAIDRPVLVDGEIVALDARGQPAGFQNLQGRIHLGASRTLEAPHNSAPYSVAIHDHGAGRGPATRHEGTALIAFDLLRDGDEDLRPLPLRERRARLERVFALAAHPAVRLSDQVVGDGRALRARAEALGWEGLVAKRLDAPYRSGRRTPDWRKLKLVRHQTCVVGGWTDPRGSRPFFGALLLGVYDERGALHCVGHTGAGFTDAELGRVWTKLRALQTRGCPFAIPPRTNEAPHWVAPRLVAEVKFTEWTADGRLRHPTYLGLRDDVAPASVRREGAGITISAEAPAAAAERGRPQGLTKAAVRSLIDQLDAIQAGGGDGVLTLPGRDTLAVSNLGKVFWPAAKLTKGDLFRHYVRVAPYILPALADRPLVMKRYPNGVAGRPFYQHRAPDKAPAGVRVEDAQTETETRPHIIGGSLKTLLYAAQLASISQDPWFSRVQTPDIVDHVAIDLDPPDEAPFRRVLDVARWVREELEALGAPGFPKTSGSGGLHIYVPMPPDTSYEAGLLFCQIVATMVAKKHPRAATIERAIKARGARVYVDFLQNIRGKTLASAYSPRANDFAGVSTPLTWEDVDEGVSPRDFTIATFAARLAERGDLWARLRRSQGANLRAVMKYAEP